MLKEEHEPEYGYKKVSRLLSETIPEIFKELHFGNQQQPSSLIKLKIAL